MNIEESMQQQTIDYTQYTSQPASGLRHIPGDSGWPILGHTLEFLRDNHALLNRGYAKHGLVYRRRVLFQDGISLLGPDANQHVLLDSQQCFSNYLAWSTVLDRIFPNGLMLKDFSDHRYHRRILQSAFKKPVLDSYIQPMGQHVAEGIAKWPRNQSFHFLPAVKSLLLDIAAQTFLGVDLGEDANAVNKAFVDAADASIAILKRRIPGTRWARGMQGRELLEAFMTKQLPAKKVSHDLDFFAQICRAEDEHGQQLDDQAVIDHIIFLLFAAHDTTTSTLCSVAYALAENPQWQEELRAEYSHLGDRIPNYDDLAKMEKTGWVFREALRMYPPLPVIPRRCLKETEVMGYRIPRNAGVALSPLFTHYMEDYWDKPTQFDPERFSVARAEHKRHSYQFVPFGGGAHKCLGLNFAEIQVKLFLSLFLRQCHLSVAPDYQPKYTLIPLRMPKDGLPVVVQNRS